MTGGGKPRGEGGGYDCDPAVREFQHACLLLLVQAKGAHGNGNSLTDLYCLAYRE